ncbi:MAG: DUF1848 family protein [Acidobacteriota bacterium]|nr:DUF1848 family protein [Acidobacteriota bacterium]
MVSLTGLGPPLEPQAPPEERVIEGMIALARRWGDPRRVVWRYDPIVLGPRDGPGVHAARFERFASALEGSVERVVVSILDRYRKTRRRLAGVEPGGGYPLCAEEEEPALAREVLARLVERAGRHGLEIQSCAEPLAWDVPGLARGRCIDGPWLAGLFPEHAFSFRSHKGQRAACGCHHSIDIGFPDSCLHGCVYCYATVSTRAARATRAAHDPSSSAMVPPASETRSAGRKARGAVPGGATGGTPS